MHASNACVANARPNVVEQRGVEPGEFHDLFGHIGDAVLGNQLDSELVGGAEFRYVSDGNLYD